MSYDTPKGEICPSHPALECLLVELEAAAALAERLLTSGHDPETLAALRESLAAMNAQLGVQGTRIFLDSIDPPERYAVGLVAERDGCTLTASLTRTFQTPEEARAAVELIGTGQEDGRHE